MTRHVYVGNLSLATTEESLRTAFSKEGRTVTSVAIVTSPRGGRSRGFGFVEMESAEQAAAVITTLDGTEIDGRSIRVREGKERPEIQIRSFSDTFRRSGGGKRRGRH